MSAVASPAPRGNRRARRVVVLLTLSIAVVVARDRLVAFVRLLPLLARAAPPTLAMPVVGVRPVDLMDTWGAPRSGGRRHEGIDIFARRGTPVVAATRGVVTGRGFNSLGGRFVRVTGAGGVSYYYAHLEAFGAPRVGDLVERGTVLGAVGTSGNANGTPPHLHFGVYRFVLRATNPYPLLVENALESRPSRAGRQVDGRSPRRSPP